jgi:hypothetical protein
MGIRRFLVALAVAMAVSAGIAAYVQARSGSVERNSLFEVDQSQLGTAPLGELRTLRSRGFIHGSIGVTEISGSRGSKLLRPGVSAGIAALSEAPTESRIPAEVADFVKYEAAVTDTDPAKARAGVRELRRNLGKDHAGVYVVRSRTGSPCFILTGYGGACAQNPRDGTPGLHWMIGGGHDDAPSVLVGVAGDDVSAVRLTVDGRSNPVSLADNAVFAEFPRSAGSATIQLYHRNGAQNSVDLSLR